MDYRPFVTEVGSYLTKDLPYEVIGQAEIQNNEIQETEIHPGNLLQVSDSIPFYEIYESEKEQQIAGKIEAFMLAQEAYSAYEIPENVSYDCVLPSFQFGSPVRGVCSSGFGYRMHPIDGAVAFHYGTDYDVQEGTPVMSFADGVISAVGEEDGYGKYICVTHDDGWRTLYAHCSVINVTSGQEIRMGQTIGESGSTGRVTGPHLHFELMHDGVYTNPEFYLA